MDEFTKKPLKKGIATAAMVLGVFALLTTLFGINYLFGILAIVLAIVYLWRKPQVGKGVAITGISLAAVSMVLSTVLWVNVFLYFMNTSLPDMMNDVATITGGAVNPQKIVDEQIADYVEGALNEEALEKVETFLGGEISYETLSNFVGEDVTITTVTNFMGDAAFSADEVQEVVSSIDHKAVMEDLGGTISYKVLEEKVGEDFTYEELMEYLKQFKKSE